MQRQRSTRVRILEAIKSEGPQPVRALSVALDITGMAVRQHLMALERDGLVKRESQRRPLGRPENVYQLTDAAQHYFPQRYDDLACDLLENARQVLGQKKLDQLLDARLGLQVAAYEPRLEGKRGAERLHELAAIQDENGFMASCDPARGEIVQRHCSICAAAQRAPELCDQELRLFERLLGVPVERVEHMLNGDAVCRYRAVGLEDKAGS